MPRSVAKASLAFTGLFEAELLTELMLRDWEHPLARDPEFRSALLESAAQTLRVAIGGERLFEDLEPNQVNFVAALWYSESVALEQPGDISRDELRARKKWLRSIARALPSCFCNPTDLS